MKQYIKNNPEKNREYKKQYYEKNKEKLKEYWINYRKKYPEKYKENRLKYVGIATPIKIKCEVCGKEIITVQHHQKYCKECKPKIKARKRDLKRRKLKWKLLYKNPFDKTEEIHYHHINTIYVVPLPSDIHRCYCGYHTRDNNEDLDYIIEQIYPSFAVIKNSLRQS